MFERVHEGLELRLVRNREGAHGLREVQIHLAKSVLASVKLQRGPHEVRARGFCVRHAHGSRPLRAGTVTIRKEPCAEVVRHSRHGVLVHLQCRTHKCNRLSCANGRAGVVICFLAGWQRQHPVRELCHPLCGFWPGGCLGSRVVVSGEEPQVLLVEVLVPKVAGSFGQSLLRNLEAHGWPLQGVHVHPLRYGLLHHLIEPAVGQAWLSVQDVVRHARQS
mmetsp:Transcript_71832/g.166180  ORF Transcript_71832/g.166180 Transcript_71832/m.166180 type:complete len:220 (-) Transcript_71832:231-890(-)